MINETEKFALVTGASSGIGWHICLELAARGYSIIAVSNQPGRLESLKQELETSYPINVHLFASDLSTASAPQKIFAYCQQRSLKVEVLVNNAGILVYGEVVDIEVQQAEAILQLHMNTPAILCRMFAENMARNQKGLILNVSSISAVMPYPTISLYGPSKTFLRQFSRALGIEMKDKGVSVTCLLPGATATALYDAEKVNIPLALKLGVMKKPEDVARLGIIALFKKRTEYIPGLLNKLVFFIVPLIPAGMIGYIHRKVNKR